MISLTGVCELNKIGHYVGSCRSWEDDLFPYKGKRKQSYSLGDIAREDHTGTYKDTRMSEAMRFINHKIFEKDMSDLSMFNGFYFTNCVYDVIIPFGRMGAGDNINSI